MTHDERITTLLSESGTLTSGKDSVRLCALYAEAATLVDKDKKPKKWAAFRYMYGQAAEQTDPHAALAAYREAVRFFDPADDRAAWASCKASIGWTLASLGKISPPESEEVIESLGAVVDEFPYAASTLAIYYSARTIGDPLENWKKRIHYLELTLEQVSPQNDPTEWATQKNALAVAVSQEPDGDFVKAIETRIGYHKEALAVLEPAKDQVGSAAQNRWIMICVDTSEAYLCRLGTDPVEDRKMAEKYAQDAYQACGPLVSHDARVFATMALARVLLNETGAGSREDYAEGLKLCNEVDTLIDAKTRPVMAATNEKFKALAHLRFLDLGVSGHLADLLKAADGAYALLDPILYSGMQRTVMQLAASGLVASGEFAGAIDYLRRAVEAGESALQQATTRAGRLECIFDLHDSYAQLGYCRFQTNEVRKGIEAIDAGKGRLWRPSKTFATFEQIKALVPKGGALLFAAFAPKDGAVAVVSEQGEQICLLKGFGRERLTQLLLGDVRNQQSSSWISRYLFRNTSPERWREAIDSIGHLLFESLWEPLIETLDALGIPQGAELVWFPQAGLGVLPLQAAWKNNGEGRSWISQTYAIRYAPSASCLIGKQAITDDGFSLIVSNPAGNAPMPNSALELAWIRAGAPKEKAIVLAGTQAIKTRVMTELVHASRAYFSTHAVFRVDDPFQSGLMMAEGEILSLEELLPVMEKAELREVILMGCETAMAQVARRPDELLGFPAAFLEHSAATVVATQWPVDDWAAAALAGRFYRERRTSSDTSAAQAMRRAQNWIREVTADELLDLLAPLQDDPGEAGELAAELRTSLYGMARDERPFADPYFWAPFTVSGL